MQDTITHISDKPIEVIALIVVGIVVAGVLAVLWRLIGFATVTITNQKDISSSQREVAEEMRKNHELNKELGEERKKELALTNRVHVKQGEYLENLSKMVERQNLSLQAIKKNIDEIPHIIELQNDNLRQSAAIVDSIRELTTFFQGQFDTLKTDFGNIVEAIQHADISLMEKAVVAHLNRINFTQNTLTRLMALAEYTLQNVDTSNVDTIHLSDNGGKSEKSDEIVHTGIGLTSHDVVASDGDGANTSA